MSPLSRLSGNSAIAEFRKSLTIGQRVSDVAAALLVSLSPFFHSQRTYLRPISLSYRKGKLSYEPIVNPRITTTLTGIEDAVCFDFLSKRNHFFVVP